MQDSMPAARTIFDAHPLRPCWPGTFVQRDPDTIYQVADDDGAPGPAGLVRG